MSAKSVGSSDQIYQLKITLRDSKPPIWRRVMVPSNFSLYKLHQVIQMAMGWTNSHLHQFIIDGQYYSIPSAEDWPPVIDERRYTLSQIAPYVKRKFVYEYDFGDSWEHAIVVEKILPPETGVKYPVCIKGKRACPPEDVGGVWGYATFLEAINDPTHEEHDSYLEWIGDEFDSEEFNLDEINQELRRVM
jgi:Plasmid pRiA4b ORF-3-like protein